MPIDQSNIQTEQKNKPEKVFLYILLCADKTYYTGITKDLTNRLKQHRNGQSKSTKFRLPVKFLHSEDFPNYKSAAQMERRVKNLGAHRYLCRYNPECLSK